MKLLLVTLSCSLLSPAAPAPRASATEFQGYAPDPQGSVPDSESFLPAQLGSFSYRDASERGALPVGYVPNNNNTIYKGNLVTADLTVGNLFNKDKDFNGADSVRDIEPVVGPRLEHQIQRHNAKGRNNKNILQARNTAFASSMAEVAASEQGGGSLSVKNKAIGDALMKSFQEAVQ